MAQFTRSTADGDVAINYEAIGDDALPALLLIAPGGMRSAISYWQAAPWDPIVELSKTHRVIAMDQRNAGHSTGPIAAEHGWLTYTQDQLALLDHLQVDRFHVAGMCIGGPYCMGLIEQVPQRVLGAILWQSIGLDNNRDAFYAMFDSWADELANTSHISVPPAAWKSFRSNLFDGDFLFNTDEAFVSACTTPLLVLCGNDLYHPRSTSLKIAQMAPNATLIENWKEGSAVQVGLDAVLEFLRNTQAA